MDNETLYENLVELMGKLSIKVIRKSLLDEEFSISSGFCKVRGQGFMILDKRHPLESQIILLARELAKRDLEDLFITPFLREVIEKNRGPTVQGPPSC